MQAKLSFWPRSKKTTLVLLHNFKHKQSPQLLIGGQGLPMTNLTPRSHYSATHQWGLKLISPLDFQLGTKPLYLMPAWVRFLTSATSIRYRVSIRFRNRAGNQSNSQELRGRWSLQSTACQQGAMAHSATNISGEPRCPKELRDKEPSTGAGN